MSRSPANLQITVAGAAVVILVGGALWFGFGPDPQFPVAAAPPVEVQSQPDTLTVHVSGSVMRPGLVVVVMNGRVADAIAAAGGATPDADLSLLNLAAGINDGDHITVPGNTPEGVVPMAATDRGIDINQSAAAELEGLPGVGPVLAQRIVDFRNTNGPYAAVEDLLGVPGIGEAKLAAMRDDIASP